MNILLKLSFDGTNYHGTQVQKNAMSVMDVFQNALWKIVGEKVDIKACSRLDTGVHAKCFFVSFVTEKTLNVPKLPLSINAHLPQDIRVLTAQTVPDDFHARYSSKGKEYTYYIWNSHIDDPFCAKYHHRVPSRLDETAMDKAAKMLVGTHDFRSFMAANSKIVDCTRTVYSAGVERAGDMLIFKISADGYLYNMVRIIVGTLIKIGTGRQGADTMADIISACDRSKRGVTAPRQGLFLTDVFYDL